jgi:hypothetical protein
MAEPAYVNQGPDRRAGGVLGYVLAWLQRTLSFHASGPPAHHIFHVGQTELLLAWPPFISFNYPIRGGHFSAYRAGWRYDRNWLPGGGYIADVIIKTDMDNRVHF